MWLRIDFWSSSVKGLVYIVLGAPSLNFIHMLALPLLGFFPRPGMRSLRNPSLRRSEGG